MIAVSLLLTPISAKANGYIDVGYTNEVQTVNALLRATSNYFISATNDSLGFGVGHKFTHAVVVGGYTNDDVLFITTMIRPKTTNYEIDLTYSDNMKTMQQSLEIGFSYYIYENLALSISADRNNTFVGIRRSL